MKRAFLISMLVLLVMIMEAQDKKNSYRKLNSFEEYVILKKGTERPFTGEYYKNKAKGTYVCKQCGCFMPVKTRLRSSNCPLQKWTAEYNPE